MENRGLKQLLGLTREEIEVTIRNYYSNDDVSRLATKLNFPRLRGADSVDNVINYIDKMNNSPFVKGVNRLDFSTLIRLDAESISTSLHRMTKTELIHWVLYNDLPYQRSLSKNHLIGKLVEFIEKHKYSYMR